MTSLIARVSSRLLHIADILLSLQQETTSPLKAVPKPLLTLGQAVACQAWCGLSETHLWPVSLRRRMSLSRSTILPEVTTRRSTACALSPLSRKSASALENRKGWLQHFFSSVMIFSSDTCAPPLVPCATQHLALQTSKTAFHRMRPKPSKVISCAT